MKFVDKPKTPVRVNKETAKANKEVVKPDTEKEVQNKENEKLPPNPFPWHKQNPGAS